MTRRVKRNRDFELSLEIKNDNFIRPPHDAQRNWLLNGALNETVENLKVLDRLAARFVPGAGEMLVGDRTQAELSDDEIMEDWQLPLMRAMAEAVTVDHGSVLEIGFGRGVSAAFIQEFGVQEHTIVECNDSIAGRFHHWAEAYPGRNIKLLHGMWQDVLPDLGLFDGVFFHTYPLNEADFVEQIGESTTFAEHFFQHAAEHLRSGGVFTYLSNEIDSLSRAHQRLLFGHFSGISIKLARELPIPEDVRDAWWSDSMIVISAVR